MSGPRPQFGAYEAVQRARRGRSRRLRGSGTGNADSCGEDPRDCCGFATCECYGIVRHRPGFNVGSWSTCSDDINCNSSIEDALHEGDLFDIIFERNRRAPQVADDSPRRSRAAVTPATSASWSASTSPPRAQWDRTKPDYRLLDVVQCAGPNGRNPEHPRDRRRVLVPARRAVAQAGASVVDAAREAVAHGGPDLEIDQTSWSCGHEHVTSTEFGTVERVVACRAGLSIGHTRARRSAPRLARPALDERLVSRIGGRLPRR